LLWSALVFKYFNYLYFSHTSMHDWNLVGGIQSSSCTRHQ